VGRPISPAGGALGSRAVEAPADLMTRVSGDTIGGLSVSALP
jgi:hypothetical protein